MTPQTLIDIFSALGLLDDPEETPNQEEPLTAEQAQALHFGQAEWFWPPHDFYTGCLWAWSEVQDFSIRLQFDHGILVDAELETPPNEQTPAVAVVYGMNMVQTLDACRKACPGVHWKTTSVGMWS